MPLALILHSLGLCGMNKEHFCPKTDKFEGRKRPGCACEFSNYSVIGLRVQWMGFAEVTGVKQLDIFRHVVVQVFCLYMAAEGVGVNRQ